MTINLNKPYQNKFCPFTNQNILSKSKHMTGVKGCINYLIRGIGVPVSTLNENDQPVASKFI